MLLRSIASSFLLLSLSPFVNGKHQIDHPVRAPQALVSATSFECPNGYDMDGTACVQKIKEKPKQLCENGTLKDSMCVSSYLPSRDCPPSHTLENGKCVRHSESLPSIECPEDYSLLGFRKCVGKKTVETTCPLGSKSSSDGTDRCIVEKPVSRRCPTGYELSTSGPRVWGRRLLNYHKGGLNRCVKVKTIDATVSCTEGYELKDGKCTLVKTTEPVCPSFSTDDGGNKCSISKPALKRCAEGFTLVKDEVDGNLCKRKIMTEELVSQGCSDGYSLGDDKKSCTKQVPVDLVCPNGTKLIDGKCVYYNASKLVCGDGYDLKSDGTTTKCVKGSRVAAAVICSEGYTLEDSNCVKKLKAPMVCPPGTNTEADGRCLKVETTENRCDEGYSLVKEEKPRFSLFNKHSTENVEARCVRTESIVAKPKCTKEFTLNATNVKAPICEKEKTCDAISVCPVGSAREGDKCVTYAEEVPSYECPEGYTVKNARCQKTIQKDCSTVEYKIVCKETPECFTKECEEKSGNSAGSSGKPRALKNFLKFNTGSSSSGKNKICEKVAVTTEAKCDKVLFADSRIACPSGSEMRGKGCVVATYTSPMNKCPEGEWDEKRKTCVMNLKKPVVHTCPERYMKVGDNGNSGEVRCVKSVGVLASKYCKSEGFTLENDRCVKEEKKICENNNCERKEAILGALQCPEGYVVDAGSCIKAEEQVPKHVCNNGTIDDKNRCVKYKEKECPVELSADGKCSKTVASPVLLSCSDPAYKLLQDEKSHSHYRLFGSNESGFHSHGKYGLHYHGKTVCYKIESQAPDLVCGKENSRLEGSVCLEHVPKKCGDINATYNSKGKCVTTTDELPLHSCPNGFEIELNRDSRYHHSKKSFGKRSLTTSNISPRCVGIEEAEQETFCPKGDLVDNEKCVKYVDQICDTPTGKCELDVFAAPMYKCAEGFTLSSSAPTNKRYRKSSEDGVAVCKKTEVAEPLLRCNKGEESANGNVKTCTKQYKPKTVCPGGNGSILEEGMCVKYNYAHPKPVVTA